MAAGEAGQERFRECVVLATLIATPSALAGLESGVEGLACADPDHRRLRDLILAHAEAGPEALRAEIVAAIGPAPLENLFALRHVAINPGVRHPGDREIARMTLTEELAKLQAQRGLEAEIAEATEDLPHVADEALTWRLQQAAEASDRALRSQNQDRTEYDLAENGARISRDEREAFDALLNRIGHSKRQH
ncbi:MAG: hypothetical protein KDE30_05070 [Novosphingobium sp.]|nr:hypothetical protein [Novosphingobium sp.]